MIEFKQIESAAKRIAPYVKKTPILHSQKLNNWLGHEIYFKAECLQKVGAFKARGACNAVLRLLEKNNKPKRVVANSSGNHAQAVAWSANLFGINSTIYMPSNASKVKAQATSDYGAEVVLCETRAEVDAQVEAAANNSGTYWIPPFNNEDVIAGQGTAALEALKQLEHNMDAVCVPCGGGGLLSGTLVSVKALSPKTSVIGAEPLNANDAAQSIRQNKIFSFEQSPNTLADGAMTLSVGDLTFEHIKNADYFYEVTEERIIYWTQWLQHLLKLHIEPTSAMAMDAVCQWLSLQTKPQKVLLILSGGNIDQQKNSKIWQTDQLTITPSL